VVSGTRKPEVAWKMLGAPIVSPLDPPLAAAGPMRRLR
jgi:hypothetical protein